MLELHCQKPRKVLHHWNHFCKLHFAQLQQKPAHELMKSKTVLEYQRAFALHELLMQLQVLVSMGARRTFVFCSQHQVEGSNHYLRTFELNDAG